MHNLSCPEDYTFEKLVLYLYLCAAYSDFRIEEDEEHIIKDKVAKYGLVDEDKFDDIWFDVLQDFKSHNDYDSMAHIEKCARLLSMSDADKKKIYRDLEDIIMADGVEEDSERINLFRLKKIMAI